jgi:hypothetical protein
LNEKPEVSTTITRMKDTRNVNVDLPSDFGGRVRSDLVEILLFGFGDSTVGTYLKSILSLETIFLCYSREDLRVWVSKKVMNSVDDHSLSSDSNIIRIWMNIYS